MGRLKEFFLIHGVYPVSDLLFHTHVSRWYSRIKQMLTWPPEQISDWQTQRMQELVADAYQYSPYYRQLFDFLCKSCIAEVLRDLKLGHRFIQRPSCN